MLLSGEFQYDARVSRECGGGWRACQNALSDIDEQTFQLNISNYFFLFPINMWINYRESYPLYTISDNESRIGI